jgi:WD40 repeat protein
VNEVGLSKYGDLMISASDDCTVRIWVPTINGQYLIVKGHNGAVKTACFNPVDSTMFATGSNDKTVKLWSVQAAKMKSGTTKFKSHDFLRSYRSHKNWVGVISIFNCVQIIYKNEHILICICNDFVDTICSF